MQMRIKTKNFHVAFWVVITKSRLFFLSMNNCHISHIDKKFSVHRVVLMF